MEPFFLLGNLKCASSTRVMSYKVVLQCSPNIFLVSPNSIKIGLRMRPLHFETETQAVTTKLTLIILTASTLKWVKSTGHRSVTMNQYCKQQYTAPWIVTKWIPGLEPNIFKKQNGSSASSRLPLAALRYGMIELRLIHQGLLR